MGDASNLHRCLADALREMGHSVTVASDGTKWMDTKRDIQELAQDVFQQHDRFRRELVGARDAGVKLYVLTENSEGVRSLADLAAWREPACQFAKRKGAQVRIDGGRLAKACACLSASSSRTPCARQRAMSPLLQGTSA